MTAQMLLCPGCRARVLANWQECKFCGETLAAEPIGATVDPSELGAPDPAQGLAAPPPVEESPSQTGQYDWSHWVNSDDGPAPTANAELQLPPPPNPEDLPPPPLEPVAEVSPPQVPLHDPQPSETSPDGPSGWDETEAEQQAAWTVPPTAEPPLPTRGAAPGGPLDLPTPASAFAPPAEADVPSEGGALTPYEGAESEWLAGPAPVVESERESDQGPSGLEPAAWYVEPTPGGPSTAGEAAPPVPDDHGGGDWPSDDQPPANPPSLFGDRGGGAALAGMAAAGGATEAAQPPTHEAFDPEEIFRSDEPPSTGGDLVAQPQSAVGWKATADAWGAPAEPEGKPKGQAVISREARLLAFGIILLVVVGLVGRKALDRKVTYPPAWTGNVQPIAQFVSKTRGLAFKHPIRIVTLAGSEFDQAANEAGQANDPKVAQALADQVATYRALGLVQGNPTDELPVAPIVHASSRAFYDLRNQQLVVRAGNGSVEDRVAIAGALSVALDDQYADLSSLLQPSLGMSTLASVVGGDAALLRSDYLRTQSTAAQVAYMKNVDHASAGDTKDFLGALAGMQSGLGRPFVELVRDANHADGVNQVTQIPPASDLQVLNPSFYFEGQRALVVDTPLAPADTKVLASGTVGAVTTYMMLGERGTPLTALRDSDLWAGDAYVSYRKPNGQVCIDIHYRGSDSSNAAALAKAFTEWARSRPAGRFNVKVLDANLVGVSACDPGGSADQALTNSFSPVVDLAVTRSQLAAGYYQRGTEVPNGPNGPIFTTTQAWCIADEVTSAAGTSGIADVAGQTGARYRSLTLTAAPSCGSTLAGQLFNGT